MSIVSLIMWIITAGFGLYLLTIWLIEYDKDFQAAAATRLPPPVVAVHALAAVVGLVLWIAYLIWNNHKLAWYSLIAIGAAAAFGLIMGIRWASVYREMQTSDRAARIRQTVPVAPGGYPSRPIVQLPPERSFPLPVVITHGIFAVMTLTLVLLTTLGVGGS